MVTVHSYEFAVEACRGAAVGSSVPHVIGIKGITPHCSELQQMIIRHLHRHLFPLGGHYTPNHFPNPYLESVVIKYALLVEEPIVWVIFCRFPSAQQ